MKVSVQAKESPFYSYLITGINLPAVLSVGVHTDLRSSFSVNSGEKLNFAAIEIRKGVGDAGGLQSNVLKTETRSFQILFLIKVVSQTQDCGKGRTFVGGGVKGIGTCNI